MSSVKAETGAYRASDGNTTFSLNLPSGLAVGDPLFMFIASASNGLSVTTPTGWTSLGSANFGTGSWVLLRRTGGWQTADGTSLSITVAVAANLTYASFGLDGTLYKTDTMTVGTVTTRSASSTASTAVSAGSGPAMLVLSAEKASSHTGAPDAPSVSPTTTLGAWVASSIASTSSCYVGIYSGTAADRTITYTTASSNGAAFQIALTSAASAASVAAVPATFTVAAVAPAVAGQSVISGGGPMAAAFSVRAPAVTVVGSGAVAAVRATVAFAVRAPVIVAQSAANILAPKATVSLTVRAPVIAGIRSAVVAAVVATVRMSLTPPRANGVVVVQSRIFTPPQWQNITVIAGMALRTKIPTSTTVYRQGGVWHNVLSPGMSLPDINACDPSPDGGVMYYDRPTPVSDPGLIADLTANALTPTDPSWTPGTVI